MTDTEIVNWLENKELWFADHFRTRCCEEISMPVPGRAKPITLRQYVELLASTGH